MGDGDLDDEDALHVQLRLVRRRAVHPRYEGARHIAGRPYFDVAVLTLDEAADVDGANGFVAPVCLPGESRGELDAYEGDQVEVAGKPAAGYT